MCLEVKAEFFSCHAESERYLIETGISCLRLRGRFTYEEHWFLFPDFIFFCFLAAKRRASATYSRRVYRVFALERDFLMKNTGFYFQISSSLNKVSLTETSKTTM